LKKKIELKEVDNSTIITVSQILDKIKIYSNFKNTIDIIYIREKQAKKFKI